jgi:ferrous iron transport protein B
VTARIALVGNPNSGKTTLFNRLTGARQTTGNWPGVTVEKKTGSLRLGQESISLIDLPGIYSLSPYSQDEVISRNYIVHDAPDVVINIIDATNLERNLYLTLQLKKLNRPMIIALNMMDELLGHGDQLDVARLADQLGVPVVAISARHGTGLDDLLQTVTRMLRAQADKARAGDEQDNQAEPAFESEAETEAMYHLAARIHDQVLTHSHSPAALSRSDRIDQVLTHKFLAIPVFLLVMFLVFQLTFHENLGGRLTAGLEYLIGDRLAAAVSVWLLAAQAPEWVSSLLVGGVIGGVGGILTFLPQIALLFLFLSILEDTGYMARAAFIMDRLFQKLGMSGRSFIPMLMGFGCTVPAIMATRTLESERDRRLTIMVTPFMSCGARLPIYAFFTGIFFTAHKGLITFAMYLLGVAVAFVSAFLLSRTVLRGSDTPFIIELPPYRLPDVKSLMLHVGDKVRDFIVRAGTIIFVMTLFVWFLQSFSITLQRVSDSAASIFGLVGSWIAPLLAPLGFGTWQAAVALLTGIVAKESVVATLEILYTGDTLVSQFTPLAAIAFMTFTLLYMPCLAAFGAIKREMHSWRWTLGAVSYQTGAAYLMALAVFQGGRLLGF